MTLRTHKKHIGWLIAEVIVQPGELAQGSSALQIRYGLASFSAKAIKSCEKAKKARPQCRTQAACNIRPVVVPPTRPVTPPKRTGDTGITGVNRRLCLWVVGLLYMCPKNGGAN